MISYDVFVWNDSIVIEAKDDKGYHEIGVITENVINVQVEKEKLYIVSNSRRIYMMFNDNKQAKEALSKVTMLMRKFKNNKVEKGIETS